MTLSSTTPRPEAPKYEQVAAALETRIRRLQPHDELPTERELLREYAVSRTTIRHAISLLQRQGLLYKIQGSGTYVADPAVVAKTVRLTSFSQDMQQRGLRPSSVTLGVTDVAASPTLAAELDVPAGAALVVLDRLRLADDQPMALEHIYLVRSVMGGVELDPTQSLYEQLTSAGIVIDRATQTVDAVNLDARQARLLEQAVGAAAIRARRVTYTDRGVPFEHAETIYRGDRYSFEFSVGVTL